MAEEGQQVAAQSIEEKALKNIKKSLKETYLQIAHDKETFDNSKDLAEKNKLWASAEGMMGPAEQDLKKFEFHLQMLRGTSPEIM